MTRRVQTNFRAGDFIGTGTGEGTARVVNNPTPPAEETSNEVPVGTSAEIQDWVGDDKDRAQRALDAENQNTEPRKGLSKYLESVLADDGETNE